MTTNIQLMNVQIIGLASSSWNIHIAFFHPHTVKLMIGLSSIYSIISLLHCGM